MGLTNEPQSTLNIESSRLDKTSYLTGACDLSVGSIIRQARKEKGLTQKELASLSGITPVQLCRIENDESIPTKSSLRSISAHVGIEYTTLLVCAGYNNIEGKQIFYKTDGSELDINRLIHSIYKVDSDLLDYFDNFEDIGTSENVTVIKLILQAMRKEVNVCDTVHGTDAEINSFFKRSFQALKRFIISSFSPITG